MDLPVSIRRKEQIHIYNTARIELSCPICSKPFMVGKKYYKQKLIWGGAKDILCTGCRKPKKYSFI